MIDAPELTPEEADGMVGVPAADVHWIKAFMTKKPSIITAPRLSPEEAARIKGVPAAEVPWLKELATGNGSGPGRARLARRKSVRGTIKGGAIHHHARKKTAKK